MKGRSTFRDRVVVVTGAAGGIGAATATLLAAEGAKLVLTDLDEARLAAPRQRARGVALCLGHDVSDAASWERVVAATVAACGRIDALVNVAGVVEPGRVDALSVADVERQVRVNLVGTVLGCRAVLPCMRSRGEGKIVNVASLGGIVPMPGEAVYCATKYAVRGFSFALRAELRGARIAVSVVCPDSVSTAQLEHELRSGEAPMSFVGEPMPPERVARAIVRALRRGRAEVLVPSTTGLLVRVAMACPRIALRILPSLERKGRARMAARRGMGDPRRRKLLSLVQVAFAAGIAAFWAAFTVLGATALAGRVDERAFLAFETAFPLADACLAIALVAAARTVSRGGRLAAPLSAATGGALAFLGLLDMSFNLLHGVYAAGGLQAAGNGCMNAACVVGGVAMVRASWRAPVRRLLAAPSSERARSGETPIGTTASPSADRSFHATT